MVVVAQLVESRIVIPVVVGSSPIVHPTEFVVNENARKLNLAGIFFGILDLIDGSWIILIGE